MEDTTGLPVLTGSNIRTIDFQEGCLINVHKPLGFSSFQVVNGIKKILLKRYGRKFKIGHAGTLDPLAEGVLIICTGKATKRIYEFQDQHKVYSGQLMLGATTPSYDRETEVDKTFDWVQITESQIEEVRKSFIGEQMMVPPIHSAVKIGGVRAYTLARRGELPVLNAKPIVIHSFELHPDAMPLLNFRVECSKGTYIRSLANEIGKQLNSGAFLYSLMRDAIGSFHVRDAWNYELILTELQKSES